jgi:hypothetical protein
MEVLNKRKELLIAFLNNEKSLRINAQLGLAHYL